MNSWLQSMKQWTLWLLGEAPLPDGRSQAMLAGTVASVAAIAVGVPALVPSATTATAASSHTAPVNPDANSSQHTVPPPSSTVAPSPVVVSGPMTSTTLPPDAATPAAPVPSVATGTVGPGRHRHGGGTQGSTAPSTGPAPVPVPTAAPAQVTSAPPALDGTWGPAGVSNPVATPLVPVDPIRSIVTPSAPPTAPLVTGAAAFVASALVTWKAPVGSTATGYDVFVGLAPGTESLVPLNGAKPVVGTSYLVTGLTAGRTYYFTVRGRTGRAASSASNEVSAEPFDTYTPVGRLAGPVVSMASTADGSGYWLASADGAVSPHGSATDLGSPTALALVAPVQRIVGDPTGDGYWEVAADGGVFAYGAAPFEGAASGLPLNSPIVDLVPTADGRGYWEVAADGGVFAYGDAVFVGSLGGTTQTAPTVGMALDSATGGYWLVSADGTATGFGAPAIGPQPGAHPVDPVVGVAGTTDGAGFWEVTRNGSVYAYGDAAFLGPVAVPHPAAPVTSVTADPSGSNGYWLVSADGGVYTFGSAFHGAG
jgi:hypothetical protein